jgi:hypothetical protein
MSDQPANDVADKKVIAEPAADETRSEKEELRVFNKLKQVNKSQLSMKVKVHSPFRVYYDGPAFSISAENATGPFDILPKHHNFISLLSPCDLVIRTVSQGAQKVHIAGGMMHIKADAVIVFLDI